MSDDSPKCDHCEKVLKKGKGSRTTRRFCNDQCRSGWWQKVRRDAGRMILRNAR